MQTIRQQFTIRAGTGHRRKPDESANTLLAQKIQQMREKHRVTPITDVGSRVPVRQRVFNTRDGERVRRLRCRFEQG